MLKGIDPLLSPELLATLRAMGHGDEIAIVDGNYPALEHARRLVRLDGHHLVPVLNAILSVMPIDGTFPSDTARYERRNLALQVPVWDQELCIQCGKCVLVCPHAVIRAKDIDEAAAREAVRRAEEHIAKPGADFDFAKAERELAKASARLRVAEFARRKIS